MLNDQQIKALTEIAGAAVESERATGLPAELSAAQCIFESGWLSRSPGNNCFGIKPDHHGAGVQYFVSREFLDGTWREMPEAFEAYATLGDCFTDHARLIVSGAPYAESWAAYQADHDWRALARSIGPIYATDPNYAENMVAEGGSATVSAALAQARAAG